MITPRTTRLVRASDLRAFREAVVTLACEGPPERVRRRLVVVPTRAAAAHLRRSVEDRLLSDRPVVLLPDLVTTADLVGRLADRLPLSDRPYLTTQEREVLLAAACRVTSERGVVPPFRLRPGLIAEMLRFYDDLRRNQRDVPTFERLALGMLEPGAVHDRGAERLVRQTRFLVEAFRELERRTAEAGLDEHALRVRLASVASDRPYEHVVLTVRDAASDPYGLSTTDWDLVARIPGLSRMDVVVTETTLAGPFHERIHRLLPGIEEVRFGEVAPPRRPRVHLSNGDKPYCVARDREEEVAGFARRVKHAARRGDLATLDRAALVVRQPLPYVYITRNILRSGGIPCQMFDALPLAAEPYAAALDLVFSVVDADFARVPAIAMLRSPHFQFGPSGRPTAATHPSVRRPHRDALASRDLQPADVEALDRALSEAGYLGGLDALAQVMETWRSQAADLESHSVLRAAIVLLDVGRALEPLRATAPVASHLQVLMAFLDSHDAVPPEDGALRARHLRARGAVRATLGSLREAYRRFDASPVGFDAVAGLVRRWIEAQTFSPRTGEDGVHLVDAESARFGDFDDVQLAGLVDGEWPDGPRRNIFYSPAILRELGWPAEADRLDGARTAFRDLLCLPRNRLVVSMFALEGDALTSPSSLLDELEPAAPEDDEASCVPVRIFMHEALGLDPVDTHILDEGTREWAARRLRAPARSEARFRGATAPHASAAWSLSALERYQDCPFKFFSADVLALEEPPEDEDTMTPRARGRFEHEVLQRFFEEWDRDGRGAITPERLGHARAVFRNVADSMLERLADEERPLERARLLGSAAGIGIADTVLSVEAARAIPVRERLLEYRLEGSFLLGSPDGPAVPLRGVADRVDLLSGNRLRVFDYKSGAAPNPKRALQVAIYALCARERLSHRDRAPWHVDQAAYLAFAGKRRVVSVIKPGAADADALLADARGRLLDVLNGIGRGEFPPRPYDPVICRACAYANVCRKDYVRDE
jgi:RecB family exonuclease